jgi:putative transposase
LTIFHDQEGLLICYCLNPNHYHLLLKQIAEGGISEFMKRLGGYTSYFNKKNKRSGSLFQGTYKSAPIKTDEQLYYTSAYINGNAEIHKMTNAEKWPYSSYQDYLGKRTGRLCNKQIILRNFKDINEYRNYTKDVIANSREIKEEMKKCQIE